MSKSTERAQVVAQLRAAQARRERRGRLVTAAGVLVAVLIVVAVIVVIGLNRSSAPSKKTTAASADVIHAITGVPANVYDAVGAGVGVNAAPAPFTSDPLSADGKPRVLYVGAEYCPYCAAERWAVVAALSRFGTFTGLGQTASASQDVYPDTSTLSFHGSSYTSSYLSFNGVELESNQPQGSGYAPLDTLDAADTRLLDTYDVQKYTGTNDGAIPFLDLGGKYVSAGASFSPQLLAGLSHAAIAKDLTASSVVGKAVLGSANRITARLCALTSGQPGGVCDSPGVAAATKTLQ